MADPRPPDVTALLLAWNEGDPTALARLTTVVHEELRRLARLLHAPGKAGHTLQPTALVNEAYLRLVDAKRVRWQNRSHFFGVSARLMRQILVDLARARSATKRGVDAPHIDLDADAIPVEARDEDFVALDEALSLLAATDARKAQVVEMRFFGGMTVEETAEALAVSPETVKRDWSLAKAWLKRQLSS